MLRSFVLPIRILRMLEIPKWTTAFDCWDHGEVICRWRRGYGPLERPGVPRIAAHSFALEVRPHEIHHENHGAQCLKENADGHDEVPDIPTAAGLIGVDT